MSADGGIDLGREPECSRVAQGVYRFVEGAGSPSELVVTRTKSIDAHRQASEPCVAQLSEQRFRKQGCSAGRQGHPQTQRLPVRDKLHQVFALRRIAASKHHQRTTHVACVAQQSFTLCGVELEWVAAGHGRSAAVLASQVAGPCGFPKHEERCARKWIGQYGRRGLIQHLSYW